MSRFAWVGLIGGLAAGCSSDTMRFTQNPFSNPFASGQRVAASEPAVPAAPRAMAAVPRGSVQAQALPPIESYPRAVPAAPAYPRAYAPAPRVASANLSTRRDGWTAAGGTAITVGPADNLATISSRYGVPASAILAANRLTNASQVAAGRQIVIPVYSADAAPVAQPLSQPRTRLGEQPRPALQRAAEVIGAAQPHARPGQRTAHFKPDPLAPAQTVTARRIEQPATGHAAVQPAKPAVTVEKAALAPVAQPEPVRPAPAREPDQTASLPASIDTSTDFRWPARGRVIAGFGANGGNEGINIAVPEGTPVKAAEAGIVTYAGSEVKGYGNLLLIKHDNGYVSAYAHNAELAVKRGDRVKRGQVIGKSGQTGNVTSPQLHFEIRKGQAPVDPIPYLSGS